MDLLTQSFLIKILKLQATIVLIAVTFNVSGQSPAVDTLQWTSASFLDNLANVSGKGCKFITYGSNSVEWIQKNGSYKTTFKITSLTSSWIDAKISGSVLFDIASENLTGTLKISNVNNTLTANLKLTGGVDNIDNTYFITGFQEY